MFRWVSKLGIGGLVRGRVNESEHIFRHISEVLLKEQDATLHLYAEKIYQIIDVESSALKISHLDTIAGATLSWRDYLDLEEILDNVYLLTMNIVKYDRPRPLIERQVSAYCKMIMAIHFDLIATNMIYPIILKQKIRACRKLYTILVVELYMIGSGKSTAEEFREQLRAGLHEWTSHQ